MPRTANRSLCLTRKRELPLLDPLSVHLCLCVLGKKKPLHAQVFANRQLYHEHTHCAVVKHQAGLHLHSSFIHSPISFHFLVLLRVFFSHPFFSSPLANLIPVAFLLSSPLLSSFSHAPVGEYNEMATAVLWCVCVCSCLCACVFLCDVTLCRSIVALSFLIPALTDHTAILRFYKPFQRSFMGKACPCVVCCVCVCVFTKRERGKACAGMFVCAYIFGQQLIT